MLLIVLVAKTANFFPQFNVIGYGCKLPNLLVLEFHNWVPSYNVTEIKSYNPDLLGRGRVDVCGV